jgi:hypothetical protein
MGWMRSHTIVVESWDEEQINAAHLAATGLFSWVSEISPKATNGYRSFFVPPDGSKEGWPESDAGNARREEFKKILRSFYYEDKSTSVHWVEVQFADDAGENCVIDHSKNEIGGQ